MWTCTCCGAELPEVPRAWALPAPDAWLDPRRQGDSTLDEELCVIDFGGGERHYFIRGTIEIPVHGEDDGLAYTVWVSLSGRNFARTVDRWEDPARVDEPPYFGWLSNQVPGYPDTTSIKARVHTDHPLALEQRLGIPPHRLVEIARQVMG
jgi:hypothetical protein